MFARGGALGSGGTEESVGLVSGRRETYTGVASCKGSSPRGREINSLICPARGRLTFHELDT